MMLVSSDGVSKGSVFGYLDTLARREEFFINSQFDKLIIMRPRMLLRHELARTKEAIAAILPSSLKIDTADVAKAGVVAFNREWPGNLLVLEHSDLLSLSK
jgi:hypothetical protein